MEIFRFIFIFFGILVATSWLKNHSTNSKPVFLDGAEGRICPGKTTAWITVIIGGLMFAAGMASLAFFREPDMLGTGVILTLMGAAIGGFMLPSLYSVHDVIWNDISVEGASKTFGPTLGKKRESIKWSDFESSGSTATQYWYIRTADNRRIYWSYLYLGYDEFVAAINEHCPDIDTSIFK